MSKTKVVLTPDQQQRLDVARQGLNYSVEHAKEEAILNDNSAVIRRARRGIDALSLSEALWLDKKDWSHMEKTYILLHVDNERNKKKNKSVSLYDVGITAGLALTTTATHLKGYHHLSAMLALLTVAKTASMAVDYVKDHTISKMTLRHVADMSETNENIKTGIRCLTPRATYSR